MLAKWYCNVPLSRTHFARTSHKRNGVRCTHDERSVCVHISSIFEARLRHTYACFEHGCGQCLYDQRDGQRERERPGLCLKTVSCAMCISCVTAALSRGSQCSYIKQKDSLQTRVHVLSVVRMR